MKRLKLKSMVLSLFMAIGMNVMAGDIVVENPRFPRKALVAPDCMVNTMINVVGVASGTNGMNCLLDENLDNYASLAGLLEVGALSNPIVSVKDLKHTYPAGTKAGFCIINESGKLLNVSLLKNVKIYFYLNGTLQDGVTVEQSNQELLSLSLIQMGESEATLSLTAQSPKPFDEIGLFVEGVDVSALNATKVKYAFVGDEKQRTLTTNNFKDIEVDAGLLSKNNAIDTILTNTCTFETRLAGLLGTEDHVTLSNFGKFPKGTRVGFKFKLDAVLDLKLAEAMTFRLYEGKSLVQETTVNANLLKLGLIGSTDYDISVEAEKSYDKVELVVSHKLLGILTGLLSKLSFYYGYIEEQPDVAHQHELKLSMDASIYSKETDYQLMSSDSSVTWTILSKPEDDNTVHVSPNGKVTNMTPGVFGNYVFKATASDGCSGTVTITKGILPSVSPDCNKPIADEMELTENIHGTSGSLISISNLEYPENIIDHDMGTYAEYIGGLALADNVQIVGVKKKIAEPMWTSGSVGKRVGFVVEVNSGLLGLNALEFYRIRLYNNKTQQYVYDEVVSRWNTISAGLIGSNQVQKVRLSVEVPAGIEFDEITLWKSGVLELQLNTLRIYGAFMRDANDDCYTDDPLGCGSTVISKDTTGASINYEHTGYPGTAKVGAFIKDLQCLIDDDPETNVYLESVIGVLSSMEYAVKLGRIFDKGKQFGIVMDRNTYVANLDVIDGWTMKTYYNGVETGDEKKGWNVLGLDAIGYGDKIYLLLNPTKKFDEVRVSVNGAVGALAGVKVYALFVRNDVDGDGIPDCEDEDSWEQPGLPEVPGDIEFSLSATHLCRLSDLTVNIKGVAGTIYTISCPEQGINNIEVEANAQGVWTWTGAMPNAFRNATLTVATKDGSKTASKAFSVHPLQTVWNGNVDTDWNNWDNWNEGSPLACTNVIVAAGCTRYPILSDTIENKCSLIHFEMGAEVVNTHYLQYVQASVDMTLNEADRYYMLSAPLHGMVTGDMFIPENGNPEVFVESNALTSPQNRFNPRIYQRLWATSAKGQTLTDNSVVVAPDETRWTPPFNALAQDYKVGNGFSMKVVKGSAKNKLTFRFPKTHTEYEYVTDQNRPTGIIAPVKRNNIGHFIYENGNRNVFPFTVKLTNQQAGTTFLAGNPFMAHINIEEFIRVNNFTSVKVYDGNIANSQILENGQLVSNGADYTHIAPMQAVFVTVANAVETLDVTYTAEMLAAAPTSVLKSRMMPTDSYSDLKLSASVGKHVANTLVRLSQNATKDFVPGEDAELLVDNEVRPVIAMFSVAGEKSLDIQQLDRAERIPLGFYLQTPDSVSLTIRKSGNGEWNGWYLSDILLQKNYELGADKTEIPLGVLSTNVGRFFLIKGDPTADDSIANDDFSCYCYREGTDCIVVRSTNAVMNRCVIYSASGTLVDCTDGESMEYRLRPTSGVNIIKVYPEGKEPKVFKVACY